MSNQLFIFPDKQIQSLYEKNINIIFLVHNGWLLFDTISNRRVLHPFELDLELAKNIDLNEIRTNLNWWSPIWTRWVSNSIEYENYKLENIILVLKVSSGLLHYKIDKIYHFTAVPHHLDNITISIAATLLKIEEIFLYNIVLDGNLLPLKQSSGVTSRVILGKDVSNINYEKIIDEFYQNKLNEKPPTQNTQITKLKKNYFFAVLYLIWLEIFYFIINKIKKREKNAFSFYKKSTFSDINTLLNNQRSFLKFYKKYKLNYNDSKTLLLSSSPKLIIAAHFQPEATSFPEGNNYSTHIEIVLKLRMLGYCGKIAYKEHPASWLYTDKVIGFTKVGIYRNVDYAKKLLSLDCIFIDEYVPLSISLSNLNYLPVTISGSIALERSLAGLHTIVAGEPWFKGLPGTINLDSLASLKNIDKNLIRANPEIAINAKKFLIDKLNNKTIKNALGVGTGIQSNYDDDLIEFTSSFNKLIN
jgi:hypothetical protein